MSTRASLLALCLVLTLAAACDRDEQPVLVSRDSTVHESPRSSAREKSSLELAGQLRQVDPRRQTLIVAFDDDLYEFAYTDSTEVVGGEAGIQGLAGKRGNDVTVHYRTNPITSTKTAVTIEVR